MQGNKIDWKKLLHNYTFVTIGCLILAFADAVFIVPLNLVIGGVSSVAVIAQYFFEMNGGNGDITDIVTWSVQILFLLLSLIFLGKKYTIRTVYASLLFPLLYTVFLRFNIGSSISDQLMATISSHAADGTIIETENFALTILAALFGGAMVGISVAITYLGNGSTGGFDVLCSIVAKHTPIKEGIASFFFDGTLVIIGIICMRDVPHGLIGILAALMCAICIQYIYVNQNTYIIADIISDKSEEIIAYITVKMDRTSTVIDATGSYTGSSRKILRVAFSRRELYELKKFIAEVDPKAFVTFTNASMVNGEGFDPLPKNTRDKNSGEGENDGK